MKEISLTHSKKVWLGIGILALIFIGFFIFNRGGNANQILTVKKGNVVEIVKVSGTTKALASADLGFEQSGRVSSVSSKEGSRVVVGQTLVTLDQGVAVSNLAQEQAKLDAFLRGTRPEDLAISQSQVASAVSASSNAFSGLRDALGTAYSAADDAVHNHADKLFGGPDGSSPTLQIIFTSGSSNYDFTRSIKTDDILSLNRQRLETGKILDDWKKSLSDLSGATDLGPVVTSAQANLKSVKALLDNLALAINSISNYDLAIQTPLDSLKTDISSARININNSINSLQGASDTYQNSKTALNTAREQLNKQKAGSSAEDIAAQEAVVASARAALGKTVITSPINGVVTRQDAKVGEIAPVGTTLVSVLSAGQFEIEAFVPEVSIGKVAVGNSVDIMLDALPGETFTGRVTYIDPGETLREGVVNYRLKAVFGKEDLRIRSGMTVDLNIKTGEKTGVLVLPRYSVLENNGKFFVQKLVSGQSVETPVTIGLQGNDGLVEIISGLKEGDRLVTGPSLK